MTVTIPSFDAKLTPPDIDAMCESLKVYGGIILKNVADKPALEQMIKDFRPHIDGDKPWEGSFFPAQTRYVHAVS